MIPSGRPLSGLPRIKFTITCFNEAQIPLELKFISRCNGIWYFEIRIQRRALSERITTRGRFRSEGRVAETFLVSFCLAGRDRERRKWFSSWADAKIHNSRPEEEKRPKYNAQRWIDVFANVRRAVSTARPAEKNCPFHCPPFFYRVNHPVILPTPPQHNRPNCRRNVLACRSAILFPLSAIRLV